MIGIDSVTIIRLLLNSDKSRSGLTTKPRLTELWPESETLRVSGRHRLGVHSLDQFSDGGLGLTVGNDADVEAVLAVLMERSLDCGDDPSVAVAENTSAEQREVDDAVAGLVGVDHCGGQSGFVGRVENQLGELRPVVSWLITIRNR